MKRLKKIDDNVMRLLIILVAFLLIAGVTKGSACFPDNGETVVRIWTDGGGMRNLYDFRRH